MTHSPHLPAPARPAYDPGLSLGIVGIVMLVIGLPFIGIFLSIAGYRKSKKAGHQNTLAQVGIWLNAIFSVVGALLIGALIALVVWGVKEGNQQLQQAQAARQVVYEIQDYANEFLGEAAGSYPDFQTIVNTYADGKTVLPNGTQLVESNDPTAGQVGYEKCVDPDGTITGFKLHYADESIKSSETADVDDFYYNTSKSFGTCSSEP